MFFSGEEAPPPSRRLVSRLKTKPCSCCVTKLSKKTCHVGMGPDNMAIHATPEVWFNGCCWRRVHNLYTCFSNLSGFTSWTYKQNHQVLQILNLVVVQTQLRVGETPCLTMANIPWQKFNPHWLDTVTSWICFVTGPCTSYIFMHIITMNLFKINGFPEHYSQYMEDEQLSSTWAPESCQARTNK